jgi:hypothetical protein
MKKILVYICLSLAINTFLMSAVTLADSPNIQEKVLIALDRPFQPAIIEKPATLPGPSAEDQLAAKGDKKSLISMLTQKLIPKATTGLIGFVGITAFIMMVVSGIRFVTAYGNDEAITKAKTEAIYAVVGLVISLLAYTVVTNIANIDKK